MGIGRKSVVQHARRKGWETKKSGKVSLIRVGDLPDDIQTQLIGEPPPELLGLDAGDRALVSERHRALDAWCRALAASDRPKRSATEDFCRAWNANGESPRLSRASLHRWKKSFDEHGAQGLLNSNGRPTEQIDPEVWQTFLSHYLDQAELSISLCYQLARAHYRKDGIVIQSLRTFERRVAELPKAYVTYWRKGAKAFVDDHQSYIVRDWSKVAANQLWVGDHHRFDVHVIDPETGRTVRPWLCMWMDARTRKFVGWHISTFTNSRTILAAFGHGVRRHGVPQGVYIDNGKDYRAKLLFGGRKNGQKAAHVAPAKPLPPEAEAGLMAERELDRSLAAQFRLQVHFARPYNARAKHVERAFRTVKDMFSRTFKSFCGGTVVERPERHAEVMRKCLDVPTMPEFQEAFGLWAEEFYNERSHGGLKSKESPNDAFARLMANGSKRTVGPELLRILLMRTSKPATVRRNGITLFGHVQYESPDLLVEHGRKVFARYDWEDLRRVEIYSESDRWLTTATMVGKLPPIAITEEDAKAHQALVAAENRKQRSELKRAKAWRAEVVGDSAPNADIAAFVEARRAVKDDAEPARAGVIQLIPNRTQTPGKAPQPQPEDTEDAIMLELPRPKPTTQDSTDDLPGWEFWLGCNSETEVTI